MSLTPPPTDLRAVPLDRAYAPQAPHPRKLSDFALGARLALVGGGESWARSLLTAFGVALAFVLLLYAAAVPNVVARHQQRVHALEFNFGGKAPRYYEVSQRLSVGHATISGISLQRLVSDAPPPPGVKQLPGPGEVVVSPAVARLLRGPDGPAWHKLLGGRVVGEISQAGLTSPNEGVFYRGANDLGERGASPIFGFGNFTKTNSMIDPQLEAILVLLEILMTVGLLTPLALFVITAGRFGSERRNERLVAIRLMGADRAMTARIATGETLPGVLLGIGLGALGFVATRPLGQRVDLFGVSAFAGDIQPVAWLAILIAVLVMACTIATTLIAMRSVAADPLAASRRQLPARRRLLWRMALLAVGFLMLAPFVLGVSSVSDSNSAVLTVAVGIVVVLIGVSTLMPWLVEALVRRSSGAGRPAWLLAVRRLRFAPGASGRTVGAISLAVAGAVALQIVFASVDARTRSADATITVQRLNSAYQAPIADIRSLPVSIYTILAKDPQSLDNIEAKLVSVRGVRGATFAGWSTADTNSRVMVMSCSALRRISGLPACTSDSAYVARGGKLTAGSLFRERGFSLKVPANTKAVAWQQVFAQLDERLNVPGLAQSTVLLLAPGAAAQAGLDKLLVQGSIEVDPNSAAVQDRVAVQLAAIDPFATMDWPIAGSSYTRSLDTLNHLIEAGALAVLLVIAASLLVATADQLRERRHVIAALAALGTPRNTLALSFVWQTAIQLAFGVALAIVLGLALGAALVATTRVPLIVNLGTILTLAGAGIALVGLVTLASLPLLGRQMRPAALRTE